MTQTSGTVTTGQKVKAEHHNKLVADATELYEITAGVGLTRTAPPDLILEYRYKANAFTVGTAPFTSQGYFRLPNGAPWGADGIKGLPQDQTTNSATTSATAETMVLNVPVLLPPHGALTLTKVEIALRYGLQESSSSSSGTCTKVGVIPIKIAADGTETALAAETFTTAGHSTPTGGSTPAVVSDLTISIDYGAGLSVAATERLGFRVKFYTTLTNSTTLRVLWPVDFNDGSTAPPLHGSRPQLFALWLD